MEDKKMDTNATPVDAEFTEDLAAPGPSPSTLQQEITLREKTGVLATPADVSKMIKKADAHIEFRRGLVKLIATKIDPKDVVIYGNDPNKFNVHYAKNACKQILAWIDAELINVRITESRYEGKEGPYIIFEASADMILPGGRRVNVVGSRATYDDFFGSVSGSERPLNEVDIPSVRMAAITNLWNHALEDAGLKPTLEELRVAGLDLSKASYVNFKEKGKVPAQTSQAGAQPAGNGGSQPAGAAVPADCISEAQAKRLFAIARSFGFKPEEYHAVLREEFAVARDTHLQKSRYNAAEQYFADHKKN